MGAFIGYGDVGVWANNGERDAFLDWYADHRCTPRDEKWEYCKSGAQRWPGACIDLEDLIPQGVAFEVSNAEIAAASIEYWPHVGKLLSIIRQISLGQWRLTVSDKAAVHWRDV